MFSPALCGMLMACALTAAPVAGASPDDDQLLQQVKQEAAKGQNAQVTAEVNQYVDSHHDIIAAILKGYMDYLKQIQSMSVDTGNGTLPQSQAATSGTQRPTGVVQGPAAQPAIVAPPAGQSASLQPSTGLGTPDLQTSGSLQTSHLAGYPALPDVDPVSSMTNPTAAQLAHGAQVQKEMQERKAYLMAHPEGYTY